MLLSSQKNSSEDVRPTIQGLASNICKVPPHTTQMLTLCDRPMEQHIILFFSCRELFKEPKSYPKLLEGNSGGPRDDLHRNVTDHKKEVPFERCTGMRKRK